LQIDAKRLTRIAAGERVKKKGPRAYGIIVAAYFIAYTICSPILGLLSDRFDPRLILTLFTALLATGTLLMGNVKTVFQASLVFALVGIGHAACWAPVVSLVQKWVSDKHRGTALAIATSGSGIGIVAWSLWLPMVVQSSSYRTGWIQMGVFALFVAGLNFFLIRKPPSTDIQSQSNPQDSIRDLWTSYLELLGSRTLWVVGVS
jgi:MFS family permease